MIFLKTALNHYYGGSVINITNNDNKKQVCRNVYLSQ